MEVVKRKRRGEEKEIQKEEVGKEVEGERDRLIGGEEGERWRRESSSLL